MRLSNFLRLSLFFTLIYYVNSYTYTYSYNNNILTYSGPSSSNYILSKINLLDGNNKVTSTIPFKCTKDSTKNVCSSDKLDPSKLVSWKISFYAKDLASFETEKNDGTFESPSPKILTFANPATVGGKYILYGDLLRLGTGDPSYINCNINGGSSKLPVTNPSSMNASAIEVTVPPGSGSFSFKINAYYYYSKYQSPKIDSITGQLGQYTIKGSNFFTDKSLVSVQLDNDKVVSSSISSITQNTIVFSYTPKYSSSYKVVVNVNSLFNEEPGSLVILPVPESVKNTALASTGGAITIMGKCLKGSTDTSQLKVTVGTQECVVDTPDTPIDGGILCKIPKAVDGQYSDQKIVVTIDDLVSTNNALFSYDTLPVLREPIVQNYDLFTGSGDNLGSAGSIITLTSKGGQTYTVDKDSIIYDTNNQATISFKIPKTFANGVITLTNSYSQTPSAQIPFDPFSIVYGVNANPPTVGGALLFDGAYLDSADSAATTISILNEESNGNFDCSNVVIDDANGNIKCNIPAGTGAKLVANIAIASNKTSVNFSYQAPSNIQFKQQTKNVLEFQGENFGNNASLAKLQIGNSFIPASSINSEQTLATFTIPDNVASSDSACIIVDGLSTKPFKVSIKPSCKTIEKSTTNGQEVFIIGSSFDSTSSYKIGLGNSSNFITAKYVNATAICFTAPKGSGANKKVIVQYNDQPLNDGNELYFSYFAPTIISSTSVSDTKGGQITIYGTNFAEFEASVKVDNKTCSNVTVIDSNSLKCILPPAASNQTKPINGTKYLISVTIDGQSVSANKFEYNNDAINTVPPQLTKPPTPTKNTQPTETPKHEDENNNSNIIYYSKLLLIITVLLNLII